MEDELLIIGQLMAAKEGDASGFKWAVRVAAFGPDLNGNYWDKAVLTAALAQFEGAKVFALKEAQHQAKPHRFGKSVHDLVGVLSNCTAAADGIYADLIILPAALWLRDNLVGCAEQGLDNVLGLSVDVSGKLGSKMEGGKKLPMMTSINNVTVDVVYDPVAKGEFLKMAAARQTGQEEDHMLQKLLAALQGTRPDLYKQITDGMTAGTISDEQAIGLVAAATVNDAGGDAANDKLVAALVAGFKETMQAGSSAELQQMQLMASGVILTSVLTASKLPEPVQDKLRASYSGKIFTEESLQAAVKAEKEMLDKLTASGTVSGAGDARINLGRESSEKLQAAFDGMLGVTIADDLRGVPVFTSLRAAYVEMTGDVDINGVLNPQQLRRMQAAYGDTTFAYALGNTLYRRLTQDYRGFTDYGVSRLVGNNIRNATDFRSLESVRIGYYGDLPTLNTDLEDYPDLGEVSDERVEYALKEKGGIITINRKMIINDDLRLVQKIISRLPRAARRTLARTVWTPFITNAVYKGDNKAIFHADHGNLGSAAYSIAAAEAAKTAMFNQLEPNSNERIGLRPMCVCFPSELRALVTNVNNFNPQAVAVENGNSMYRYFADDGLFQNPFQTDVTDWMMCADPNECECVELAYLNGQQEPLMLVADNPANGQMFVGGRLQYKISHDYNSEVVDYRGCYKGIVAG
ncbi:MAG: hypothetical protein H7X83_08820 [Verrucomicrobia bacterium]|nr:hypothetical protein [Deltaproteobacteria bacterium]